MKIWRQLTLAGIVGFHCIVSAQAIEAIIHPGKHWQELLIAKDYPALELAIKTLHEESLRAGTKRRELEQALTYLAKSSTKLAPLFDEFANASPDTFGAMTRGYFLVRQGWAARGPKFANETSGEQFARMKKLMSSALQDFERAVKGLNNRCDPCYAGMINIGMTTGNVELKAAAINASERYDEGGFEAPLIYMHSLKPQWGGTEVGVEQYVNDFAAHFPKSFTSQVLKAALLIEKTNAYLTADETDKAQLLAEQAVKIDPGSSHALQVLTTIALKKNEFEKVIETASLALAIEPNLISARNGGCPEFCVNGG